MGLIYKITNNVNNKVYIGQTTYTLEKRWGEHTSTALSRKCLIHKAISKYGKENFSICEIARSDDSIELDKLEILYISKLNSLVPNGYNLESGGNKFKKLNEETKQKIRESNTGFKCKQKLSRKVTCLDLKTNIERSYPNMGAAEYDGFLRQSIKRCCDNKDFSHKGYRWKWAENDEYPKYQYTRLPTGLRPDHTEASIRIAPRFSKDAAIHAIHVITNETLRFNSITQAVDSGFDQSGILRSLSGKRTNYRGYVWRYTNGT